MTGTTVCLQNSGRLRLYDPPRAPRGTVVVCPGGAYQFLSPREGPPVAAAFVRSGWAAAELAYSVRPTPTDLPVEDTALQQAAEAVALLHRQKPDQPVVLCGFSAGGHLAGSLGVRWQELDPSGAARPEALVLCYPVITAGPWTHEPSMENLAGTGDRRRYSLEERVSNAMPPVFLWHTVADQDVPVQNSLLLARAMTEAGVPYEMHLYPHGVHGLSLATAEVEEPAKNRMADSHVAGWFALCLAWLDGVCRDLPAGPG